MKIIRLTLACICLLFLCSCATEHPVHPQLPADVTMNKDAGRIQLIFVMLHLENGEELPFLLDTGAKFTCFDQSLEPKLGKRLDGGPLELCLGKYDAGVYVAPKLYLGNSLLQNTGTNIVTLDLKPLSSAVGRPIMGILGIDVLEHYCIQLDFAAGRIRFLDDENVSKKNWGKSFPLTAIDGGGYYISENLAGGRGSGSAIDTGCLGYGWLTPALFQQWTNQAILPAAGQVRSPNGRLDGESYPEIALSLPPFPELELNGLGIYYLSRHLVTLDFPKRTLYLKRTSVGPLRMNLKEAKAEAKSAAAVLRNLHEKGQLPGWSKDDKVVAKSVSFSCHSTLTGSFTGRKIGDSSVYHFQVIRASEDSPWKLQKAWRTDAKGQLIEECPVP